MTPAKIAATIPAFQAEATIAAVVRGTIATMGAVLVIDDGSSDQTATAARAAGAEVISLPENRGKGTALRRAFAELYGRGYDAVLTLDADGQHLPSEIPVLLTAFETSNADLVLGTRDHLFAAMSPLRRFSNTFSSRAISFVAGKTMNDIQTGFRIYKRELIAAVGFPEARFSAESAVVVRALRRGFKIATVPIELGRVDGRNTSHYRPLVDSWRIACAVASARFEKPDVLNEPRIV